MPVVVESLKRLGVSIVALIPWFGMAWLYHNFLNTFEEVVKTQSWAVIILGWCFCISFPFALIGTLVAIIFYPFEEDR